MEEPLVSVVIPAYNAAGTVCETIDSVLAQSWPRVEIIVVDDGSTDGTGDMVGRYLDHGVHYIHQSNSGAASARNKGFEKSRGEFVIFFDADDVMDSQKLEIQVRAIQDRPGAVSSSSWGRFYHAHWTEARFVPGPDWKHYQEPREWLIDDWCGRGTMPPGCWLYPRRLVEQSGGWNEDLSLNDDMEFFTRVTLLANEIVFCRDARWYYRSGRASLSNRKDDGALWSQYQVIRLSTGYLLDAEDSERTRHASACFWQTFLYLAYPSVPELRRSAEQEIKRLGGGSIEVDGGRAFRLLRDVLGWKAALRVRNSLYALRGA